jgi:hypothetical protein
MELALRFWITLLLALCAVALEAIFSARADNAPAYVVPGRPDVPVMMNGYDASWGVIEGDWGLYRPGAVSPTLILSPYAAPLPPGRRYFPSLGAAPNAGRYEIEPPANRALPPPAESFHRSWSSSSDMSVPATVYAPSPAVIAGPEDDRRDDSRRHRNHH